MKAKTKKAAKQATDIGFEMQVAEAKAAIVTLGYRAAAQALHDGKPMWVLAEGEAAMAALNEAHVRLNKDLGETFGQCPDSCALEQEEMARKLERERRERRVDW